MTGISSVRAILPTSTSCRVQPGAIFFLRRSSELPTVQPRSAATLRSDNLRSRLRRHAGDAAGGSIHFSWFFAFLIRTFFLPFRFFPLRGAGQLAAHSCLLLSWPLRRLCLASQRAARLCNGAQRPPSLSAITFSDVRCLL